MQKASETDGILILGDLLGIYLSVPIYSEILESILHRSLPSRFSRGSRRFSGVKKILCIVSRQHPRPSRSITMHLVDH